MKERERDLVDVPRKYLPNLKKRGLRGKKKDSELLLILVDVPKSHIFTWNLILDERKIKNNIWWMCQKYNILKLLSYGENKEVLVEVPNIKHMIKWWEKISSR